MVGSGVCVCAHVYMRVRADCVWGGGGGDFLNVHQPLMHIQEDKIQINRP